MTAPQVVRLRCEHRADPLGVDTRTPRLSWQVRCARRGAAQSAYQVLVSSEPGLLAQEVGDLWDSGRVESDDCVLVPYRGEELVSRQRAHWSVRVWDDAGTASAYAPAGSWEMGLLDPADWQAEWVATDRDRTAEDEGAVTYLRSRLRLDATVRRARAYVTALGLYELHCNGRRVGEARFTPGWTDYEKRLQYQVFDLTDLLQPGDNAIGAVLAEGWYAGYVGFLGQREHYGSTPQLLVQVEVETDAGTLVHTTGPHWSAGDGPIRTSDMLRGEAVDGRMVDPDWCRPTASPPAWPAVRLTAGTEACRVVSPAPPVTVLEELVPATVTRIDASTHRVDLGQNVVGWLRLRVCGDAGTSVTVRHAEAVNQDGTLHTENLRTATSTDRYVLGSDGTSMLEPSFTFHGFRYADVIGADELTVDDVTGVVCGSALEQIGTFSCSDPRVDRLHANIVRSARGNFLEIPTDCPQRDERLGWTGDAQVFAPTACYLFDTAGFFTKWLRDLGDTQTPEGSFADVAPRVVLGPEGSAGWADAGVLVPWTVFAATADRRLLAETYPAMRRWVGYVERANPGLLWLQARGYDNGDWLAPGEVTDKDLIATAFFARSARVTALVAEVLGRDGEAAELRELADAVRVAFQQAYLREDGELSCGTQTAYALALRFDLLPEDAVAAAARRLAADVAAHGHLTTGFLGVPHLLPALSDAGRTDLAYRLLLAEDVPSWLHSVRADATTIWERWDGWTPDGGFYDPGMNSFNHYAFGAVGEWLHRTVGGLSLSEPGGRSVVLAPCPDPALSWARVSHLSPRGQVSCAWRREVGQVLEVRVEVPVGARARVRLPADSTAHVREGGADLAACESIAVLERGPAELWLEVGSGRYVLTVTPG